MSGPYSILLLEFSSRSHLHLVLEGVGVAAHTGVSLQFTQHDALFKEEHLSLVSSGGGLHLWRLLPHREHALKRNHTGFYWGAN